MARELTWREAIDKVLAAAATPLHYKEIATKIVADGLRISVGATPAATVYARICASMKHESPSPYVRVGKGTLALASASSAPMSIDTVAAVREPPLLDGKSLLHEGPSEVPGKRCDIVTSFGVCWMRDAIRWNAVPRLLGMRQLGSAPVDFNRQAGVYLLYDGREVVYIGRATERRLGEQLLGHTFDRMAARWDRFSWFGLLPVLENGQLGMLPADYDASRVILVLQTILIEALEPRLNRAHGDDLSRLEFIQREDPELKRARGPRPPSRLRWQ